MPAKAKVVLTDYVWESLDVEKKTLEGLADLVVRTVRSQVVAVAGNLIVVIPLSALLAYAVYAQSGEHYVARETAEAMLRAAGLRVVRCELSSRERRKPYFEVVTAFATSTPENPT